MDKIITFVMELPFSRIIACVMVLPFIAVPIATLRKKGCTTEINVIWYAFSLVFVVWWCLNTAMALSGIEPPEEGGPPQPPTPWLYFYSEAEKYLSDLNAELSLVASIIIIAIAPQLLTYVLSGLSGCASTPRFVWQFGRIAIWSLVKFLAAFGGLQTAQMLGKSRFDLFRHLPSIAAMIEYYAILFRDVLISMALAFTIAVLQIYFLEAAHALGQAWNKQTESWPYRVHRFFTRNLPKGENPPSGDSCVNRPGL